MQTNVFESGQVQTVDDLSAPTILVDTFSGFIATGGVVILGCLNTMLLVETDEVMTPKKKVVLRLAIPFGSLPALTELLQTQVAQMVRDGAIRPLDTVPVQDAGREQQ
jgi:hypothetical protein